MKNRVYIFISCLIIFYSCKNNSNNNIAYIDYTSNYSTEETINVPFHDEYGVKFVTAKINGAATIDMIIDTGCSETLISLLEAQQLIKRGLLSEDDFIGTSKSIIADGSIVENMIFNLKTIELSDGKREILCRDILVQISTNIDAPVLLGNGVLDRVASYEVDNIEKVIKFKLK
ncbi:MAG: retroviral-like aspartic protease family protein [bacterium]